MNAFLHFLDRRSGAILLVLTTFLLTLETYYALNRPLNPDEFSGAWSVVQVGSRVPYADFEPYKPVLGYYVQLGLLQLGHDPWGGFVTIRLGMTCLAVVTLFLGALWLRRVFRPAAVCLAYALLVVMTSLVEWAIEVRLDMLTGLFGFVSLLFLLRRRVALAGLMAGLSFLISQKGATYGLSGGFALLGLLAIQRDRGRAWDVLKYVAGVVIPIGTYVAIWCSIVSWPLVLGPTFGQTTQLHALAKPMPAQFNHYLLFWLETLFRNPLFYIYILWALGVLLTRGRGQCPQETLLLFYGLGVAAIMLSIQQPWAYMFVLLVPTAFVLHCYLFTREISRPDSLRSRPILWVCYVMLGLVWPLSRVATVAQYDQGTQRQTLELAAALLQPGDRYFAGFQLLYRGDAHERALGMADFYRDTPIQDLPTAKHAAILERFQEEPIRFVVYTGIIDGPIPAPIKKHVHRNYAPFWANIWIYAPQALPKDSQVNVLFTGSYTVETEQPGQVLIDGKTYGPGETLELERGRHEVATSVRLRLKLQPKNVDHLLNPAYREPMSFFWPDVGPAPEHFRTGVWAGD